MSAEPAGTPRPRAVYEAHVVDDEEQRLIAAAVAGDQVAFAALVGRHQEMAFRVAYLLLRDAHAAEDIAQDGFLRAYRALDTFRLGEPFRPWLLRIVSNLAKNELRARARRARLRDRVLRWSPTHHEHVESTVIAEAEREERVALVRQLLDEAPEADREVLVMRHVAGMSEAEMAEVLDVAPGTVKSRLSRARMRLRTVIEAQYPWLASEQDGASEARR